MAEATVSLLTQCSSFPKKSHSTYFVCGSLGLWPQHKCIKLKHLRLYEGRKERFLDLQCYLFCILQPWMKSVIIPEGLDQFGFHTEKDPSCINSFFKTEASQGVKLGAWSFWNIGRPDGQVMYMNLTWMSKTGQQTLVQSHWECHKQLKSAMPAWTRAAAFFWAQEKGLSKLLSTGIKVGVTSMYQFGLQLSPATVCSSKSIWPFLSCQEFCLTLTFFALSVFWENCCAIERGFLCPRHNRNSVVSGADIQALACLCLSPPQPLPNATKKDVGYMASSFPGSGKGNLPTHSGRFKP